MAYAKNEGIRIHYEVEGEGPPLVLGHGATRSLEMWRRYVEVLKEDYQLVLFDARGHGASDKPHNPEAYQGKLWAGDVVAVLGDLGIAKAHYFGYSLGATIGFGLATHAPDRFHSLILGGFSPYRYADDLVQFHIQLEQGYRLLQTDPEAYIATREETLGRLLTPKQKAQILAQDPEALSAMSRAFRESPGLDNATLSAMTLPCLLFAGEGDEFHAGAKEAASHMPNATFVSLPGLNHVQAFNQTDLVLPHIRSLLAEVSQA